MEITKIEFIKGTYICSVTLRTTALDPVDLVVKVNALGYEQVPKFVKEKLKTFSKELLASLSPD